MTEEHYGHFSRIGDVLKANINDMIDRAKDPEKMVKQIIWTSKGSQQGNTGTGQGNGKRAHCKAAV